MALPAPDYLAILDYTKPVKEISVKDFRNGEHHVFTLFHCTKRRDMFRVEVNGKEWKKAIGYSALLAAIRKAR